MSALFVSCRARARAGLAEFDVITRASVADCEPVARPAAFRSDSVSYRETKGFVAGSCAQIKAEIYSPCRWVTVRFRASLQIPTPSRCACLCAGFENEAQFRAIKFRLMSNRTRGDKSGSAQESALVLKNELESLSFASSTVSD